VIAAKVFGVYDGFGHSFHSCERSTAKFTGIRLFFALAFRDHQPPAQSPAVRDSNTPGYPGDRVCAPPWRNYPMSFPRKIPGSESGITVAPAA
jgi:hypothetical protein